MTKINAVAVYCGASVGNHPKYAAMARQFGRILAANGVTLVFGGGTVGLMGAVSQGVLEGGGEAHGVITTNLLQAEAAHSHIQTLEVVDSMHIRKQRMFELADAFVILPGGVGTLDEFFEVLTWRQLRLHDKPIVIVDQDGYWEPLRRLLDHTIADGFAARPLAGMCKFVPDIEAVLPTLQGAPSPRLEAQPERT